MDVLTPSFYVTGGTMRQDAPSYVERQADQDLYENLLQGEFCYVLTSRQMGKSSLMVRTAAQLREVGVAVAVLDPTAIGLHLTVEQWYDGLLGQIGRALGLEDELEEFWLDHDRMSPLQRWMAALQVIVLARCPGRIALFLDEIDMVRSLPFSTDELFAAIRQCYNRRSEAPEFCRLSFCLLGQTTPGGLIQDTRITPFNIGKRIELTDFSPAAAAPLAKGLGRDPNTSQTLLQRVLYWTGGHPYLTQRLCQAVAQDETVTDATGVDRHCEALFLSPRAQEKDDNLLFVRERLLRGEADVASLLDLYQKVRDGRRVGVDDTNRLIDLLRLAGVVKVDAGRLRVRNPIYARVFDRSWVTTHMPDAELRRQQAAFRRGLVRAGVVAGVVLALISSMAFAAVSQAARARLGERVALVKTAEAQRLAARLQQALGDKDQALRALQRSLAAERLQRRWADRNKREARSQAWRAEQQRRAAVAAHGRAIRLAAQRQVALGQADSSAHRARTAEAAAQLQAQRARAVEGMAEAAATKANRLRNAATLGLVQQAWENRDLGLVNQTLGGDLPAAEPGFPWAYWQRLAHLELMDFRGHAGSVLCAAYSPDGRRIVTGGGWLDQTAIEWDAATGKKLFTLAGHTGAVNAAVFSPDGRWIVTAGDDRTARVWDAVTGKEQLVLEGHTSGIAAAAFSPDGRRIVTGSYDRSARVWDATTARLLLILQGSMYSVRAVAFSPDGRSIAAGVDNNAARIWDAATGRPLLRLHGHQGAVSAVTFSRDGRRLLTGSFDRTARVWDAATGKELFLLRHPAPVSSVAISPDGREILTGASDGTLRLWDATSGQQTNAFPGHGGRILTVAFSPDGQRVLTTGVDQTAKVWDRAILQEHLEHETLHFKAHGGQVCSLAFSPDGRQLVTASIDGTAKLWNVATGQAQAILQGHHWDVSSAVFSPDGQRILTGSRDGTARVWKASTGTLLLTLNSRAWVHGAAFSPNGRRIATADDNGLVKIWDAARGGLLRTLRGRPSPSLAVGFSPDGLLLVTGRQDGTAEVWDVASGSERRVLPGRDDAVLSVAFLSDGRRIVTCSEGGAARLWNAGSGREMQRLIGNAGDVSGAVFSPDRRQILTAGGDGTVKVWDARIGQILLTLKGDGLPKTCVALSSDGLRIATGSWDGTVDVWTAADPAHIAFWNEAKHTAESRLAPQLAHLERLRRVWAAQDAARVTISQVLQPTARSEDGQVTLEWHPVRHAVGYQLYRRLGAGMDPGTLAKLTPRPVTGTTFIDRVPGLVNGDFVTYAVAPLLKSAGSQVVEGPRATLTTKTTVRPPRWIENSISGWMGYSMNEGALAGSTGMDAAGIIALRGSGPDFWDEPDGGHFLNQPLNGDFQITAQLLSGPTRTCDWAKAGLMIRESLATDARNAFLAATPEYGLVVQWRGLTDQPSWFDAPNHGSMDALASAGLRLPMTLRLTRRGNRIVAEYSLDDGMRFQPAGEPLTFNPPLPQTVYTGLAITAHNTDSPHEQISEAKFAHLKVQKLSGSTDKDEKIRP